MAMKHGAPATGNGAGTAEFGLLGISLASESERALSGRIYAGIREAILDGRIVSGQRLPSSRALAEELGVARGTVVEAYEQLQLEGYVRSTRGSGTYVDQVPEQYLTAPVASESTGISAAQPSLSDRAAGTHAPLIDYRQVRAIRPFQAGVPPLDEFPRHLFARIAADSMRTVGFDDLGYGPPAGYEPLRDVLASYLRTARAVACEAQNVIVTNGAQHALSLAAHVLLDVGEALWMENPGYRGARAAFSRAGLRAVPVSLDAEGLSIEAGRERAPDARLIYVTPSHQYPMGVTMSARRRLELIEWARRHDVWIVEDDYDSEYRYDGAPLPALQHFDRSGRVLYVGSLSKVLAPGLRLGYLVVPTPLVEAFASARASDDHHSPILMQMILARFIEDGHYGRHLRRMRRLGELRRDALVRAFAARLPHLALEGTEAGLHALVRLDASTDDQALATRAAEYGLTLSPLSAYDLEAPPQRGLVLGYAAYTERQIEVAVGRLAEVLAMPG